METRIKDFVARSKLDRTSIRSPMFTCSRDRFARYANNKTRLVMGDFYKEQRKRLDILIDPDGQPRGDRWSFDAGNRKKLPKSVSIAEIHWPSPGPHVNDVIELVRACFPDNPGNAADFRWPTTRQQVSDWLDDVIGTAQRLGWTHRIPRLMVQGT